MGSSGDKKNRASTFLPFGGNRFYVLTSTENATFIKKKYLFHLSKTIEEKIDKNSRLSHLWTFNCTTCLLKFAKVII